MTEPRQHPTWEEMRAYLEADAPTLHTVAGKPTIGIFIDPSAPKIGLRAPLAGVRYDPSRPLSEIETRVATIEGASVLELTTENPPLFPYFYAFALALADLVQLDAVPVPEAVERSFEQWRTLLRQASMLTEEEQTGLMGELWMLERLARRSPPDAIAAWTGPRGEAHDFRLGAKEFEIKATRGERRVHLISGVGQLVPSPGMSLYLLSLQFAAGGAGGTSISVELDRVHRLFDEHRLGETFDQLVLRRYGISQTNRGYYREALQMRSRACLVPVTDDLPSISQDDILAIPRPAMERVSDVRYRLDVTGLGFVDGSPEFFAILPEPEDEA